ncbi:MAG: hypothetical protein QMD00_04210 [Hadesarchaea archaeon]|nr:hypothetical protein [Hadesarchaea archaeon]
METISHFWELAPNTYFRLSDEFWKHVISLKGRLKLSWRKLKENAKIDFGNIDEYATSKQMIPLPNLLKLQAFLCSHSGDLNLTFVEAEITEIRNGKLGKVIKFPNLPVNFLDPRWGTLVGAIRSEGTLRDDKNGSQIANTDLEYMEKLKNSIERLLGQVSLEIRKYSRSHSRTRTAYYLSLPFIFSDVLIRGLKLEPGNKILVDASLPNLYMSFSHENPSQIEVVATTLKWLFSGDGWVTVFKDHLGQTHRVIGIAFSNRVSNPNNKSPPKLLLQTVYLLKKFFGIQVNGPYMEKAHSHMTPSGKITTTSWKVFIRGYNNLKKFYENIGFVEKRKNELLKSALDTYKRPKLGNGENLKTVLEIAKNMRCITSLDIVEKTKMSLGWAQRLLKHSMKEGYLKIIDERHKLKGGGRSPYVYKWIGD